MPEERTIPIPAGHREFTVKVDGQEVERTNQLLSATVTKMADKISAARLVYLDGDASSGSFPLSNADTFLPGKEIEILGGDLNNPVSLFKGIVVKISSKIRDRSAPQLIIECRHKAVRLSVGRKNAYFTDQKDSDVIQTILSGVSIQADVEPTSVQHKQLVQFNSTDWDFILSRAQANGKLVYSNDDSIVVKAPAFDGSPVFTLQFGSTILEMDGEIESRRQFSAVKSFAWDASNQQSNEQDASDPGVNLAGNLSSSDLSSVIGLDHYRLQEGMLPEAESKAWADAYWLRSKMGMISGRLKCEGIGTINPGDILTLQGVGDRYNGNILVNGVRQSFDLTEGWKTHIQFGITEEWFGQEVDISAPQAGALLPAVHGLQIGVVLSNEDPDGEHRVKVKMPLVDPSGDGAWARVASLDAGDQRGFFFRPEIGDEVILGFLEDDPRHAVILGMLHSSAKAAPLNGSDSNNEKVYKSRSGMKLFFDDEKKMIKLETPVGKKITMDEDENVIRMEDESGNKIEMNSDGIKITSTMALELKAGTDLKLEGLNMNLKMDASMSAEASASMEIKSSGSTTIKGSIVQIN
ncbi:MAG: type VI secretion system tip protein VgrG [Bacteroidetes bacterium]|nr:type VI secretion system tip protein VgrG [Bacteroidota bacterium]